MDFNYQGFEWIDFRDTENSVISFMRKAKKPENFLVIVCNFTPVPRSGYRVGVPENCFYKEILNSDSQIYWGSNMGNVGGILADKIPWNDKPYSVKITIPPLSVVVFKPVKKNGPSLSGKTEVNKSRRASAKHARSNQEK
jgi:1,4-alpha-glucan branching enzyme